MKTVIADIARKAGNLSIARISSFLFVLCVLLTSNRASWAQGRSQAQLELELILTSELQRAQVLSLTSLGITGQNTGGQKLFDLIIQNRTDREETELYFNITFSSQKRGLLVEFFQVQGQPFGLDPFQLVTTDNVQMQNNIPGIEEDIVFEGGFTSEGEQFFNNLEGSTKLPSDIYTIKVAIFDQRNSRNGGILVTEEIEVIGGSIVEEVGDLYLIQPGDAIGSDAVIHTSLPVFRWEGPFSIQYRLIVVEEDGQNSPEALLQTAESSAPTLESGAQIGGSLQEFEIVDALINNTTFSMPPNGVQNLKEGKRYYWQVSALQKSVDGANIRPSEIWTFRIAETGSVEREQVNKELNEVLKAFLSEDEIRRLERNGFELISITVDGQTLQGVAALQKLVEMRDQLNEGDITIVEQ